MDNVAPNKAMALTVNMFGMAVVVVSVLVVSTFVVSKIVVTSTALIATTATASVLTAVVTTSASVLVVAATAVVTAVALPSHSYFQSWGWSLSGYGHSVRSHSSRIHTGYSLRHSSHSVFHAAVADRVAMLQSSFCHCNFGLSQFTHSEYSDFGCRINDHSRSRVCM